MRVTGSSLAALNFFDFDYFSNLDDFGGEGVSCTPYLAFNLNCSLFGYVVDILDNKSLFTDDGVDVGLGGGTGVEKPFEKRLGGYKEYKP